MANSVAEDHPLWGHAIHAHQALLDFIAYVDDHNALVVDASEIETSEQSPDWPFSEFPQIAAVQDMYRPEPKQMPMLCFQCGHTGEFYVFAT